MVRKIKKAADRKLEIIRAARHLFQSKGYDKVTMHDVMDVVGIAKGTIYHYFKSKEELFEAVVENIVDSHIERMEDLMHNTQGTALEKMQVLVSAGNISSENKKILGALHERSNDVMHARLLAATVTKQALLYEEIIRQGCLEGAFHTTAPREVAEFMLAGIQFLIDLGIYPWSQEDLYRRTKAFPAILENLLQAPKGSFNFLLPFFNN